MKEFLDDFVSKENLKNNKASNFLTNHIFNNLHAFVFIFDFEKTVPIWVNKYFETRMGYSEDDLMNITSDQFMSLFHPNSLKVFINRISNYCSFPSFEKNRVYQLMTKDGKWINIMVSTSILKLAPDGKIKYLIGYGVEIIGNELQKSLRDLNELGLKSANLLLIEKLSKRELEVITNIANCLTDKEIAEKLRISEHTVISHRKNMLHKTHTKNTAELVHFAVRKGII